MELQLITFAGVLILVGVLFSLIKNIFKKTLHKACEKGDIEAVKQFLGDGVDVNAEDENGWTPLHGAAWWGHKETAKFLIGSGADVDAQGAAGNTPLHQAAEKGHKEIIKLLIAKGADVNAMDEEWPHTVRWPRRNGQREMERNRRPPPQTRRQDRGRIEGMKHLLLTTIAAVVLVGCGPSVHICEAAKQETLKPSNSTWLLVRM